MATTRKKLTPPAPATTTSAAARSGTGGLTIEQALLSVQSATAKFPDPDEMLRKAGLTRASLRPMETDDEVSQCLDTRREALLSVPWRLEPGDGPGYDMIKGELDANMEKLLRTGFAAVPYGYSVSEVVYEKKEDGHFGIKFVAEKPFEWFEPKHDGRLIYRGQTGEIDCDLRKYVVTVRSPTYRQPYGEALLTRIYWIVFFKTHGRKFWAKFLERFGEPLLIGQVADQEKFIQDVMSLGLAAGLPVQPGDSVSHVAVSQAGEFDRFDANLSAAIQKSILGQTLTSQVGNSGSYAAAKIHNEVRMDKRDSDLRLVVPPIQKLIDTLLTLNNLPLGLKLVMADDTGLESDRAARDAVMVSNGILKLTKQYILDRYDYNEDDFILVDDLPGDPAKPEPNPGEPATKATMAAQPARRFTPKQQVIEDAIEKHAARFAAPVSNEDIRLAIMGATSPEDVEERLAVLLSGANTDAYQAALERAYLAADIIGYAHAEGAHG